MLNPFLLQAYLFPSPSNQGKNNPLIMAINNLILPAPQLIFLS